MIEFNTVEKKDVRDAENGKTKKDGISSYMEKQEEESCEKYCG